MPSLDNNQNAQQQQPMPNDVGDGDMRVGDDGDGARTVEEEAEEAAETSIPINKNTVAGRRQQYKRIHGTRGSGFNIPSTAEEEDHAKERWEEDSWQLRALSFINSDSIQKVLICLLVLDVLILFAELAIDAMYPVCDLIIRDAVSCCQATDDVQYNAAHNAENDVHRLLGGDSHDEICKYPLVKTNYEAGCDSHAHEGVHIAHQALFWTTITILCTFEIELFLLIYLLGFKKFFRTYIYVVDLFVVTVSLVLELMFRLASNRALEVLPGILVIFRLWRFVRVGHGLVASTYEVQVHKTHLAIEHIEELEKRLKRYEDELPEWPKKLKKHEE